MVLDKDNVYGEEQDEWNECFDEDYVTLRVFVL